MKLSFRQIEPFVKAPPADVAAVLLYGPDSGLVLERLNILTKTVVADLSDPFNICELTAAILKDDPARLADEAQSLSMLGGRRVIRVRDADDTISAAAENALKSLKPGDNFILIAADELSPRSSLRRLFEGAKNAAALPCYIEDARDIGRIIQDMLKAADIKISADALHHMAANVVGDRGVARSEAEKLILYMGDKKTVALEDAVACVGSSAALSLDDLCKAAASGHTAEAERVLAHLLLEGTPPVRILRGLQNHFTRLYLTKTRLAQNEPLDTAMKKLKPEVFWKNKDSFASQVRGWSETRIEKALALLCNAEGKCKQTGLEPDLLCSRAVLTLTQQAARQR